jgi:hypothetical protein
MADLDKNEILEEKLMKVLESMSGVCLVQDKAGGKFILKNGAKFGVIKDETIYLMDQANVLAEIDSSLLNDADKFLELATKSYWVVSKMS